MVPRSAILDEQPDAIGLVLMLQQRPLRDWQRDSLERHVAVVDLPFPHRGRPVLDVRPRRPPGIEVVARHLVDPDDS